MLKIKEQLLEETKNNYKLKDELNKKTKEYQETYKDVREEIKDYKIQLKQREEVIDETIKFVKSLNSKGRDCMIYTDVKKDILNKLQKYKGDNNE